MPLSNDFPPIPPPTPAQRTFLDAFQRLSYQEWSDLFWYGWIGPSGPWVREIVITPAGRDALEAADAD